MEPRGVQNLGLHSLLVTKMKCVYFSGSNKPIKVHFVPHLTFGKWDFSGISNVFQTLHCFASIFTRCQLISISGIMWNQWNVVDEGSQSYRCFNSKCCIVANWTCLTCNVLFLSLKVPPVTKSLASPSSTSWCQTPSRTRHSSNLSTAFKPCVNVCVSFIRKWIKQLPRSIFMMMTLVLLN